MKTLDEGSFAHGILVDLQRPLILLIKTYYQKIDHNGIRVISNKEFETYLTDRKQFVSINGLNSDV